MKTSYMVLISALALGGSAWMAKAQQDGGAPPHGQRPPRFAPPIIMTLDANKDRVIDATEIANSPTALKTLDKNSDGQLTADEYRPQFGPPPPPPPAEGEDGTNTVRRPPPFPPSDPVVKALDANQDGVIDANEIANAPTTLKALDKNGDGQLTKDELAPEHPNGRGPGGPPDDSLSF
jgi:hypothetical protein